MQSTSLYKIYAELDENLQKSVQQALESPIFNRRPELLRLWAFLKKNKKKKTSARTSSRRQVEEQFSKQDAFEYTFGKDVPYDDGKMRHYIGYLLELIRDVLAWIYLKKENRTVHFASFSALKLTGADVLLEKEIKRLRKRVESDEARSSAHFLGRFQLEKETWELLGKKRVRTKETVQNLRYSFSVFVAINALQQACIARSQKVWHGSEADFPYLQQTLDLYENGQFEGEIAVKAWASGYYALTQPNQETAFQDLKMILHTSAETFPMSELRDLYILALNVCIRRANAAEKGYIHEAFDLYKSGLTSEVFLENGHLAKATYRNVLNAAVKLGEWEWALAYLKEFAEYLAPAERENIYQYNLATYHFRKGEYDAALELLRHVEMSTQLENFDVRRMLLRIYFAQGAEDALHSLLDSFSIYLQRHKDGSYHHKMYTNLVRFSKKITNSALSERKERAKLRKAIQEADYLAEREWLLSIL